MKKFVLVFLNVLLMMIIEIPLVYSQGAPMPFRIGGTVTIDGVQITQATDDGILIRVTKPDGTNYEDANGNAPEDKDGLNAKNWYMIDIPIYKATAQPKGATPGETAAIHVYKNSQELRVTNPPNGQITIGGEGTSSQIDLTITTPTTETVSTPSTPSGPTSGTTGTSYSYSSSGSVSSLGHQVEYQFDWKGDGSDLSPWGLGTRSKTWTLGGIYNVKARARCASDTSVISSWSGALTVSITSPGAETVSTPNTPTGPTSGGTGTSYTYSTGGASSSKGHSVQYLFDWGDGTNSGWLAVGQTSASKSWASIGTYSVKAQARCASDTSVISSWSGALAVSIASIYDDFEKTNIDPNKWDSWEYVREIEDGKLVSKINAYGKQVNNALSFKNPNSINYIEADVVIKEAKAEYDPNDSSMYSQAYAFLTGYFYNDGTASGPGSLKGEVQVVIRFIQDRGQLFAEWKVYKAMDDGGTNWSAIGGARFSNSIDLNTTYKLSILFEPSLKRFTFRVGTTTLTWTSSDTIHPSNNPWKAIGTQVYFSSSTGSFSAKISATFDNVIAKDESGNVVMSDDFSFPIIDSDKWGDYEFVREVGDGKLWLDAVSVNQSIKNELFLKNPDRVKDFQAKVTLFGFENFDGASTRARLGGHFYNDTGNPGSGYMGDVWAEVTLGGEGETPSAGWLVVRYNDQGGNNWTILDTGTFPIFIDTDETYNLFLGWDGSKFTFKCDESVGSYTPTAVKYPPNYNYKELAVRISAPSPAVPSYSAYISAAFDDVRVTEATTPPPNQYALTISKNGTGGGTVTSSPAGINCGTDCSESYNKGANVSLTATASSGSTFTNWSGACSGTGTCSVTMNSNKTVTATFNQQQQQQYTLTVAKSGTGSGTVTSSPAGINCGDDCSETYTKVQKVKLTAKADTNSGFDGWSGGGCSGTKTCQVNVNGEIIVTASFAAKNPDIAVSQDSLDFGGVKKGKSLNKTLKITNNGSGDLAITTITGLEGTNFSISGSSSITIKSKKSYNLKVTFKPTSTGSKTATLRISSNDPDTPTLEIPLSGTGQ